MKYCLCICVFVYVCMYENVLTVMWQRHDPWWQWWHLWKESLRWVCDHDKWLAHRYLHPNNPLLHNTQHHYIITRVTSFTLDHNICAYLQYMYHIHNIQSAYKNLKNWSKLLYWITMHSTVFYWLTVIHIWDHQSPIPPNGVTNLFPHRHTHKKGDNRRLYYNFRQFHLVSSC